MNIKQFLGLNTFNQNENGEEMQHEEIYSTVVNAIGLDTLVPYLPATKDNLEKAYEKDQYLNNIPLKKWGFASYGVRNELAKIGITSTSISDGVCTLKSAARMYIKQ